jgi:D-inositol-3-phosphate glycosyltransferase
MKICIISFHSCPYSQLGGNGSGGMSVYLKELTSALADLSAVKIDIFTRAKTPVCVETKYVSPQIRVVQLKGGPEYSIDRQNLYEFIPEFSENLEDFILRHKENYDIIHSHYWLSGLAGGYIKQKLRIPLVHTYHTLGYLKKRMLGQKEHHCRDQSERHIAHISDILISPSREEKESLIREYGLSPSKVKIVYPGVNHRLFYPVHYQGIRRKINCKKDDFVLLYVGRIEPVKGLATVISSLEILKNNRPDLYRKIRLLVVGGGRKEQELAMNPEAEKIINLISQKTLTDKVKFLGSIDQHKLKKFYSAANALIVPSLYESFGLVTVEALACGTPVIVSKVGKMKTIVKEGKNGISFLPNDPISLSQGLVHFFLYREKLWNRERIREDIIRRFSWEKTAEETYEIFTCLIEKSSLPTTIFQPDESLQQA